MGPQVGLACPIRRISSAKSRSVGARPVRDRDFQNQMPTSVKSCGQASQERKTE
jgi:hypothetical protein